MSTPFFITPYDPKAWEDPNDDSEKPTSDLEIDPTEYQEKLLEQWSYTVFLEPVSSPPPPLEWRLKKSEGDVGLFGGLQRNLQVVWMRTPYEEFFVWHRSIIPPEYPLYLFNSSSWDRLELTLETTEDDIKDFFLNSGKA